MSQADFLGRAIEQVKKAIETDTAGDYEAAYQQYYSAREYHGEIKCSKNMLTRSSRIVHARLEMYVMSNHGVNLTCLC